MKKKWYRNGLMKGFWLTAVHAAAIIGALSIIAIVLLLDFHVNPMEEPTNFVESSVFDYKLYDKAGRILHELKQSSYLGDLESHTATGDSVIDLQSVLEGKEPDYTNTSGLAYSIDDLIDWSNDSWDYCYYSDYYGNGKNILVCQKPDDTYAYYYYNDFSQKIREKELFFSFDTERFAEEFAQDPAYMKAYTEERSEEYLSMLNSGELGFGASGSEYDFKAITDSKGEILYKDIWNYTGASLTEKYAPQGAENILEIVNDSPNWNGRLEEAFQSLNAALERISATRSAQEFLEQYKEGNSNLTYLYITGTGSSSKVYTNKAAYSRYDQAETSLKAMKNDNLYLILRPELSDCETNIPSILAGPSSNPFQGPRMQDWHHLLDTRNENPDYIFALQVDSALPLADSLAENRNIYDRIKDLGRPAIFGAALSVIFFLVGFVWLTVVAGRRPEDEEIHLNSFDRWYTEIGALAVFLPWIFVLYVFGSNYSAGGDLWGLSNAISFTGMLFSTVFLFFIGYLSLVRRIKAHTIWKNSLLRRILLLLKKSCKKLGAFLEILSRNTSSKIKTAVLLTAVLFTQTVLSVMPVGSGFAELLFLLGIADLALLAWLLIKADGRDRILEGLKRISGGELTYKISLDHLRGEQKTMAELINNIGSGLDAAVESSLKNERMKTELITNVSHDIKTPLTSIINYVDLLQRENFTDPKVCGYLDVLAEKAQRLKILTEDVVEASKASTGNISLEMTNLDFVELLQQVIGEFEEKFQEKHLTMMVHFTDEPSVICADGRRMWRVLENIFNNVGKYAMEGTRVYAEVKRANQRVIFSLKNISAQPLNFSADELTERFIRGDVSRNTEGSGLGLSIAKSLTELQGGEFKLHLDGDLFKVVIVFVAK